MDADASDIQEHMKVVGSDGEHVGTVDHVEGNRIKLTKNDPAAGGQHHYIPTDMVASVGSDVRLSQPASQVMRQWQTA